MNNPLLLLFVFGTYFANSEMQLSWNFVPKELICLEYENAAVQFNVTWCYSKNATLRIVPQRAHIVQVIENSTMNLPATGSDLEYPTNVSTNEFNCTVISSSFVVYGKRLGRSKLYLMVEDEAQESDTEHNPSIAPVAPNNKDGNRSSYPQITYQRTEETHKRTDTNSPNGKLPSTKQTVYEYKVVVGRDKEKYKYDFYFTIAISVVVVILTFSMGCKLHWDVIVSIIKKPIQPAIGLGCQFVIMPLVAFGISKAMGMEPEFGLGLFTLGCSPGGGASNLWTILFNGDLDLSMTMTFMSTLLAFGMMPLWMFALSRFFVADVDINIPFQNIFASLCLVGVPCVLGLLLQKFRPQVAKKLTRIIKPGAFFLIIFIIGVGSYINYYMFPLIFSIWYLLPGGFCLPWIAAFLAYTVAKMFRQPHKRAITIAIETGIQNIGISIIVLKFSLVKPEGDLGVIMPVTAGFFSPMPLYITLAVINIRKCIQRRRNDAKSVLKEGETELDRVQNSKLINGDTEQKMQDSELVNGNIEQIKDPHKNDDKITDETKWLDYKARKNDSNEKVSSF